MLLNTFMSLKRRQLGKPATPRPDASTELAFEMSTGAS
jgi:hypothetical protein